MNEEDRPRASRVTGRETIDREPDENRQAMLGVAALAAVVTFLLLIAAIWTADYAVGTKLGLSAIVSGLIAVAMFGGARR